MLGTSGVLHAAGQVPCASGDNRGCAGANGAFEVSARFGQRIEIAEADVVMGVPQPGVNETASGVHVPFSLALLTDRLDQPAFDVNAPSVQERPAKLATGERTDVVYEQRQGCASGTTAMTSTSSSMSSSIKPPRNDVLATGDGK